MCIRRFRSRPYSPARIVYEAYQNGLDIVGIMDHDSIGGAEEFIEAGKIFGLTTTVGFEIRTDWSDTPFKDRRLNNPDQIGCAYNVRPWRPVSADRPGESLFGGRHCRAESAEPGNGGTD